MSDTLVYEKSPSLGACPEVIMRALETSSLFLLEKEKERRICVDSMGTHDDGECPHEWSPCVCPRGDGHQG